MCGGITHLAKDCPQKASSRNAGNGRVKLKICKHLSHTVGRLCVQCFTYFSMGLVFSFT